MNEIGAEGARMISEALKINSTLTKLYLSSEGEKKKKEKIIEKKRKAKEINR